MRISDLSSDVCSSDLDALLAGTGLTYRHSAPNTVTIEKAALAPHTFSTVPVHAQKTVPIVGANGSRDRYATENSGRYAARGRSVGRVDALDVHDTQRHISLPTQPNTQEQHHVAPSADHDHR